MMCLLAITILSLFLLPDMTHYGADLISTRIETQ